MGAPEEGEAVYRAREEGGGGRVEEVDGGGDGLGGVVWEEACAGVLWVYVRLEWMVFRGGALLDMDTSRRGFPQPMMRGRFVGSSVCWRTENF